MGANGNLILLPGQASAGPGRPCMIPEQLQPAGAPSAYLICVCRGQDAWGWPEWQLDLLVEYCVAEPVKAAWENLKAYLPAMFQSGEAALKRADANSWTRAPSVGDAAARNLHGRDGSEAGE
eukprot:1160920-Pelagomonas_calceolata.AAC.9